MFAYPAAAAFNGKVPKSKIYQHARALRSVQQRFVEQVERIVWQYKLSPETIHLPGSRDVPEVQVFAIELRTGELDPRVLRSIDQAIRFPILHELSYEGKVKEIAAFKRPSESDSSKWVVGDYYERDWQPATGQRTPLPVSLNLPVLYAQLLRSLMPHPPRDGETLKAHAERLGLATAKQRDAAKLEARMKNEKQFNRKVELNAELRQLNTDLENLIRSVESKSAAGH